MSKETVERIFTDVGFTPEEIGLMRSIGGEVVDAVRGLLADASDTAPPQIAQHSTLIELYFMRCIVANLEAHIEQYRKPDVTN